MIMKEMTKSNKNLIKRIEKDINKMASFDVWSKNIEHLADVQEIIKSKELTTREFYDHSIQEYRDIIERIKEKYRK